MTDTDRMVVWLREAMDAAEKVANAAARRAWSPRWEYDRSARQIRDLNNGNELANIYFPAIGTFVEVNNPAAVLRRIAADRKILAAHPYTTRVVNPVDGLQSAGFGCETCHDWDGVPEGRGDCATILALAEGWGWTETSPKPDWPECMCTPAGECGRCWEKRQEVPSAHANGGKS